MSESEPTSESSFDPPPKRDQTQEVRPGKRTLAKVLGGGVAMLLVLLANRFVADRQIELFVQSSAPWVALIIATYGPAWADFVYFKTQRYMERNDLNKFMRRLETFAAKHPENKAVQDQAAEAREAVADWLKRQIKNIAAGNGNGSARLPKIPPKKPKDSKG